MEMEFSSNTILVHTEISNNTCWNELGYGIDGICGSACQMHSLAIPYVYHYDFKYILVLQSLLLP